MANERVLDQTLRELLGDILEDMRETDTFERGYNLSIGSEDYTLCLDIEATVFANSEIFDPSGPHFDSGEAVDPELSSTKSINLYADDNVFDINTLRDKKGRKH